MCNLCSMSKFWNTAARDVASVRTGGVLRAEDCERFARINKMGPGQWSARILVEEPFDRTNAAR